MKGAANSLSDNQLDVDLIHLFIYSQAKIVSKAVGTTEDCLGQCTRSSKALTIVEIDRQSQVIE